MSVLRFYAWTKQILYFQHIQACLRTEQPVSLSHKSIQIEGLPADMQFFVDEALDQLLDDLRAHEDKYDEAYESEQSGDDRETDYDVLLDTTANTWKAALLAVYVNVAIKCVELGFVETTTSVVLTYMNSMRIGAANIDPSEAAFEFGQEDKQLKQALVEYVSSSRSKQKSQFLTAQMHRTCLELVASDPTVNRRLVQHAIRYGYPLHMSAAKLIAQALDALLRRYNISNWGVDLKVQDESGKSLIEHKVRDGFVKVHIRQFGEAVFICQADYRASIGMSDQMNEEVDTVFVYESLLAHQKHLKSRFSKQAETLRAGLLKELDFL